MTKLYPLEYEYFPRRKEQGIECLPFHKMADSNGLKREEKNMMRLMFYLSVKFLVRIDTLPTMVYIISRNCIIFATIL